MTADNANQTITPGPSTMLHTLTMAMAAVTLVFAMFAMIFGSRVVTLQKNDMQSKQETAASEATATQAMEKTLNTAQQALKAEKAASAKVQKQLAVAMKDLKLVKEDLANANQAIEALKSTSTIAPEPASGISEPPPLPATPPAPATQPIVAPAIPPPAAAQQPDATTQQPAPGPSAEQAPVEIVPQPAVTSQPESTDKPSLSEESIAAPENQPVPTASDTEKDDTE